MVFSFSNFCCPYNRLLIFNLSVTFLFQKTGIISTTKEHYYQLLPYVANAASKTNFTSQQGVHVSTVPNMTWSPHLYKVPLHDGQTARRNTGLFTAEQPHMINDL